MQRFEKMSHEIFCTLLPNKEEEEQQQLYLVLDLLITGKNIKYILQRVLIKLQSKMISLLMMC